MSLNVIPALAGYYAVRKSAAGGLHREPIIAWVVRGPLRVNIAPVGIRGEIVDAQWISGPVGPGGSQERIDPLTGGQ